MQATSPVPASLALQETGERDYDGYRPHSPFQGYMTLLDALHVEADGGDGAMASISAWSKCEADVDIVETILDAGLRDMD